MEGELAPKRNGWKKKEEEEKKHKPAIIITTTDERTKRRDASQSVSVERGKEGVSPVR